MQLVTFELWARRIFSRAPAPCASNGSDRSHSQSNTYAPHTPSAARILMKDRHAKHHSAGAAEVHALLRAAPNTAMPLRRLAA
jgi:hypothetical protein